MELSAKDAWTRLLVEARRELPDATVRTWLEPAEAIALSDGRLILAPEGRAIGKVTYVAGHFSYCCLDAYPPGAPGGWRWTDALGGGPLLDIGIYLAFGIREILA